MAELGVHSLQDRKVLGSNPVGSNSDQLVSITCIDGYIVSDSLSQFLHPTHMSQGGFKPGT